MKNSLKLTVLVITILTSGICNAGSGHGSVPTKSEFVKESLETLLNSGWDVLTSDTHSMLLKKGSKYLRCDTQGLRGDGYTNTAICISIN